jgi:predicted ribosome quality control (RQC) complex YloA/Tae2 family protein
MNFDTFSVAAMAAELRQVIAGGRVQEITQINSLAYGLEIFVYPVRHYLLLSTEPQAPRLHLSDDRVRRGVGNETPLMLVLRKYLRGAILQEIEQPPYERVLHFRFKSRFGRITLTQELLGTRSNLLLLAEDQTILGVARLPKADSSQRRLVPGHFYELPPAQAQRLPTEFNELALRQELAEASPQLKLTRLLPQVVMGVSPFLAREMVYRAFGRTNLTVANLESLPPLLAAVQELFTCFWQDDWQPVLVGDEAGQPIAFAPYPVRHLPQAEVQSLPTFSLAVELYYADAVADYAAAKAPLAEAIEATRSRLARRRERLVEDAAAQADPAALKAWGEAILAFAHQIRPGQSELVPSWGFGDDPPVIKLDPALSASDNAQQYFSRYRKALRAADEIPDQLAKIDLEQAFLDQVEQDLAMAENRPEIDTIAGVLAETGYYKSRKSARKRHQKSGARPLRLTAPDGATVWVGKNALQNADLTFNRAKPDDLWLHARGLPGSHVIIPTAEGLPSKADVFWAAAVAAYYSKARRDTSVEVDVTVKKQVRAIKGAAPGLVTYRNESTLRVAPHAPEVE